MAVTLTVDAFLDVVRRSRLVSTEDLERHIKELAEIGVDTDSPKAIAQVLTDRQILTRWQADYLLQGKHKGFFLGPYRFLSLLGKGGMGAVYLAQHEMMRRRCAIKVLPAKLLKDKSSVLERFYREAQAVAALDHPNIVRAYDVNKEVQGASEIHYLVMEYVEGRDLQTYVQDRGRGLEFVEAADYIRQAACGLAHAHESGLIHRDIKPANLLVDTKGVVKILDLGLARFFDDGREASLTKAYQESILGTADYLSPEQALNSHQVDTRTDIYSLGCTCYFLITGQPPFPEGSVAQRLIAHQVKSPTPIEKLRPDAPRELISIVERMIAKKPENRYQSANDVAQAMRGFLVANADPAWKQQHRELVSDTVEKQRTGAADPTRAKSAAAEDTEVELGLAPGDDEEGVPITTLPLDSAGTKRGGSSKNLRPDSTPKTTDAGSGSGPLPASAAAAQAATSKDAAQRDSWSQPLEDVFSQSPLDVFPEDPLSSATSLPGTANALGSGAYRLEARQAPPESSERRQLVWLLLIGLGISTPLAAAIIFLSYWNAPKSFHSTPAASSLVAPEPTSVAQAPAPPSTGAPPAAKEPDRQPSPKEVSLAPGTSREKPTPDMAAPGGGGTPPAAPPAPDAAAATNTGSASAALGAAPALPATAAEAGSGLAAKAGPNTAPPPQPTPKNHRAPALPSRRPNPERQTGNSLQRISNACSPPWAQPPSAWLRTTNPSPRSRSCT